MDNNPLSQILVPKSLNLKSLGGSNEEHNLRFEPFYSLFVLFKKSHVKIQLSQVLEGKELHLLYYLSQLRTVQAFQSLIQIRHGELERKKEKTSLD